MAICVLPDERMDFVKLHRTNHLRLQLDRVDISFGNFENLAKDVPKQKIQIFYL